MHHYAYLLKRSEETKGLNLIVLLMEATYKKTVKHIVF